MLTYKGAVNWGFASNLIVILNDINASTTSIEQLQYLILHSLRRENRDHN